MLPAKCSTASACNNPSESVTDVVRLEQFDYYNQKQNEVLYFNMENTDFLPPIVPSLVFARETYTLYFGIRPSFTRCHVTQPSQFTLPEQCVNILGRPVRDIISPLDTVAFQDMPRIQRILLRWKMLSGFSCLAHVAHVSLPYSSVLVTWHYRQSSLCSLSDWGLSI